jgi:two-component system, NtrC family, response regulator HydG
VNVRVVAATNRDLEMEVKAGRFREDLFYRLRVARVAVPPLRERGNDVVMLAEAVLAEARVTSGKTVTGLSREATERLLSHDWPGNVRELRSAVQHGVIHCQGDRVDVQDLPPEFQGPVVEPSRSVVVEAQPLDERERVLKALDRAGGNRSRAARDLGIGRATLYRRLKSLGIDESSSER